MKAGEIFLMMRGRESTHFNATAGHHAMQVWGVYVRAQKQAGVTGLLSSSDLAKLAIELYDAR